MAISYFYFFIFLVNILVGTYLFVLSLIIFEHMDLTYIVDLLMNFAISEYVM